MKHEGVHHVSLNVADLDACTHFYVDVLGLEVLPRPDFGFPGLWLNAGGQQIHLMQMEGWVPPKGQHFAFRVPDLDEAIADLASHDVKVKGPFAIENVGRQAFFDDPDGNTIELNCPNKSS